MKRKNVASKFYSGKDHLLMSHLFEFSASTIEQINRDVFSSCSMSFTYRKLKSLKDKELIERRYFTVRERPKSAYVLTKKGYNLFIKDGKSDIGNKFRPNSLSHDLTLVDIKFNFMKLGSVEKYRTENIILAEKEYLDDIGLKDVNEIRPDGLVTLEGEDKSHYFTIEYEAARKYSKAMISKIERYYYSNAISGALFIFKNKRTLNEYLAIDKNKFGNFKPKIYYILLEDMKKSSTELVFLDKNNVKLIIM